MWSFSQGGFLVDGKLRPELADFLGQWSQSGMGDADLMKFVEWIVQTAAKEALSGTPAVIPAFQDRFIPNHMAAKIVMGKVLELDETGVLAVLDEICRVVDVQARLSELRRVQLATLDADTDVWSTTDDNQIVPLTGRIQQLL